MKALVVDDSRATRSFMRRMLSEAGWDVVEAGDGQEALRRIDDSGPFAVAIVDWNMPVMTGIELVEAVRSTPYLNGLKVLMMTSEAEIGRMTRALEAGADDYMMKPFSKEALLERLRFHRLVPGEA
jgi:two-component system chemotaxis response regulator CheY